MSHDAAGAAFPPPRENRAARLCRIAVGMHFGWRRRSSEAAIAADRQVIRARSWVEPVRLVLDAKR